MSEPGLIARSACSAELARKGNTAAAVEVLEVDKSFGHVRAVDHANFNVPSGSIHGLLGPNGAGKTTVLRMLFGLVYPDAGAVRVLGRSPFGIAGLHGVAGFIESPQFYPYLSATRNLDFLSALDGAQDGLPVDEVLAVVGLDNHSRTKIRDFSRGMRQRLGIAAALLRDPHLLLLDEPTGGLDPAGVHDLHILIRALAASGRTVLLSSHDMAEVEQLCDSVTIMSRGRVVFSGALDRLRADAPAPIYLVSSSDDDLAAELALRANGVHCERAVGGLVVYADAAALDDYVIALGRGGVAVRRLARRDSALEALFLRLTCDLGHGSERAG